jgi:hypothetical protein
VLFCPTEDWVPKFAADDALITRALAAIDAGVREADVAKPDAPAAAAGPATAPAVDVSDAPPAAAPPAAAPVALPRPALRHRPFEQKLRVPTQMVVGEKDVGHESGKVAANTLFGHLKADEHPEGCKIPQSKELAEKVAAHLRFREPK